VKARDGRCMRVGDGRREREREKERGREGERNGEPPIAIRTVIALAVQYQSNALLFPYFLSSFSFAFLLFFGPPPSNAITIHSLPFFFKNN